MLRVNSKVTEREIKCYWFYAFGRLVIKTVTSLRLGQIKRAKGFVLFVFIFWFLSSSE